MSSLGIVLLLKIFPALLPPLDENDRDFYDVLGISKGASESDIRKAYKQKSLALHPDKVAQRRESAISAEEAAKEYQLVQEAHTCLSDKSSRQKYHAVQCSPTRYRFFTSGGGLSNQMALLKNLSQASFGDKTRLVLFVSIFPALVLIQPILIAVKVNHLLQQDGGALEDAPWMALLIPWWLLHGLFVLFWFGVGFIAPPEARLPIFSTAVEQLLWLIAFILMALRWDGTISSEYAVIFIPVYLALLVKWHHTILTMSQISKDMSKMVSKDHFMTVILRGREPEELEEEELKQLHDQYVVVSQIPADIEHELETDEEFKNMTDEEKEEIRVSSSREFEAALEAYSNARRSLIKSMALDVAFLILLIMKVDNHVNMSWWLVFLPILLSYGLRILYSCFICCCLASPMDPDEVVVLAMTKENLDKEEEEKKNSGDNDNDNNIDANGDGNNSNNNNQNGTATNADKKDEIQDGAFPLESEVTLYGLNTAEFNGKTGIVKGPIKDGRQEVYISELDKSVALKVLNMKLKTKSGETVPAKANDTTHTSATYGSETKQHEATTNLSSNPLDTTNSTTKPSEEAKSEEPTSNQSAADGSDAKEEAKEEGDNKKDGDKKDDDEASFHIDPETYKAYQSAYAAAEQNVMEDRVKAGQDNCVAVMKITMVCLLVAKLESAYEAIETREEIGDDASVDVGFNTLWLIFPLFLVAGFMIFCCACLIYSAPDPEELMKQVHEAQEGAGAGDDGVDGEAGPGDEETPIVFVPRPPPTTTDDEPSEKPPAEEAKANNDQEDSKPEIGETISEAKPPEEDEGDINDLD